MSHQAFPEPSYRTEPSYRASVPVELVTRRVDLAHQRLDIAHQRRSRRRWRKGIVITLGSAMVALAGAATWKLIQEPAARTEMTRWATFGRVAAP